MCYGQRSLYGVITHAFTARNFGLECVKYILSPQKSILFTLFSLFLNPFPFFVLSLKSEQHYHSLFSFSHSIQKHHLLLLYCSIIQTNPLFLLYIKIMTQFLSFSISLSLFCPPFPPMSPFLTPNSIALLCLL